MKDLKYSLFAIKKNIKNEKELKSSFIITVIGMMINNLAFLFIWYYFGKTVGVLNGWAAIDIFGLYGFSASVFGLVCALFDGLFKLPTYISTGNFDKYLLTPKNILLKVSTSSISTSAIGDTIYGIICFTIYAVSTHLNIMQILLSILLVFIGCIIFYSFSVICMSISFYLMDGYNISHGLFGMFVSNSLYHGGAFTGVLRMIFIFVIPSLLVGAIPIELVKFFSLPRLLLIILLTIFWFILSVLFFYKSLKKYESNNLFGFGS